MSDDPDLEAIYQRNSLELFAMANECSGKTFATPQEKLTFVREVWERLEDLVHQQKRNLDYRAGEHKPEQLHSNILFEGKFGDWFS